MSGLRPGDFAAFFGEVYKDKDCKPIEPFPWQNRLADRVCDGDWPRCIALPTAAGKTACIDIAIFALACQAELPPEKRAAPRRVFFVVDRRVVVDQAYAHASRLGAALADPKTDMLKRVAAALLKLGMGDRPLDVYALRGGMYRESAWVRSPIQPTIITSTVDQVGSRLLFRGYGVSDSCKPLHAALVGNDSLILLDEAHCATPFDQTMTLVEKYRGWAEQPLPAPFRFVTMTATPTKNVREREERRRSESPGSEPLIFELNSDDLKPDKPLGKRIEARKPAKLVIADRARGAKWRAELVNELVKRASALKKEGFRAVGVIVNRVATARETAAALASDGADVILLTGRMRPMDRDAIMAKLEPLFSGESGELSKPTFVVATQCLEVGADIDFHALVTECASLDALRQRFGRLNRVAARSEAKAVVVIREDQTESSDDATEQDPVYGNSLAKTWQWLNNQKDGTDDKTAWIDFGIASIREKLENTAADERDKLSAPAPDAAVLLPAHLDCWVQTSPIPAPDPDPAVFLHGPSPGMPDVQVVFRADLGEVETEWAEIVSLCPPSSSEVLSVRLDVFKRWLANKDAADDSSDVEGDASGESDANDEDASAPVRRRALRWRGPDSKETRIIDSPAGASRGGKPHDLYVVPIADRMGLEGLGDFPGGKVTDQGDEALQRARDRAILRLTPTVHKIPSLAGVTIDDDDRERDEKLSKTIQSLATAERARPESDQRQWLLLAAESLSKKSNRTVKRHPLGGFVVIGKKRLHLFDPTFAEAEESWESASDRPYSLADHCGDVAVLAQRFAERAALNPQHVSVLCSAARLHDAGKADPRFQAWLHGGNRRKAELFPHPLAKSIVPMPTPRDRDEARERAAYPRGGRHEFLSVRLAESNGALPPELSRDDRDLILHLIAAHHGHCRPFAPVVEDPQPEEITLRHGGHTLRASSATALERLDSGVADRFWKLTRRYGWWGLPWLESILRLADWAASEAPTASNALALENQK